VATLILSASLVCSLQIHSQQSQLTKAQIAALVQNRTPDAIIATNMLERGLSFLPNEEWVETLENDGAGPRTLDFLRSKIPKGNVHVLAPEGATVSVDGKPAGGADRTGDLVITQMDVGDHVISAEEQGYTPDSATVSVPANGTVEVQLHLLWTGGYLSIRDMPEGAVAQIDPLGSVARNVEDWPVAPGAFNITVTQNGMLPFQQKVNVEKGKHVVINVLMSPDPAIQEARRAAAQQEVAMDVSSANSALQAGNWQRAERDLQAALNVDPQNPLALSAYAEVEWQAGQIQAFIGRAVAAIQAGGTVTISLLHKHEFPQYSVHPATLSISPTGLHFDPGSYQCKFPAFTSPWSDFVSTEVKRGGPRLLSLGSAGVIETLLNLHIKDGSSHQVKELDFASPGSVVMRYGNGYGIQSRPDAQLRLAAVAEVISSVRR
jgi:hypothetical protein